MIHRRVDDEKLAKLAGIPERLDLLFGEHDARADAPLVDELVLDLRDTRQVVREIVAEIRGLRDGVPVETKKPRRALEDMREALVAIADRYGPGDENDG